MSHFERTLSPRNLYLFHVIITCLLLFTALFHNNLEDIAHFPPPLPFDIEQMKLSLCITSLSGEHMCEICS